MESRRDELERFKTEIPLPAFAAEAFGYRKVPRKSSRNSCFMTSPANSSKIAIQRGTDQHWTYWSVTDAGDRGGSTIDFVANRTGENLGLIRKRLRPYLSSAHSFSSCPHAAELPHDLEPLTRDVLEVRRSFETETTSLRDTSRKYLCDTRGIPPGVLDRVPFQNALFADRRRNVIAPHYDHTGVTGWEIRNHNFKGFSPQGYKSLWFASPGQEERRGLVVAEAFLNAISYGVLHPDPSTCYLSTGGSLSPLQRDLLRRAFEKLPINGSIVIAADQDAAGERFASDCQVILVETGREDLSFRAHCPLGLNDWNDVLREHGTGPIASPPDRLP